MIAAQGLVARLVIQTYLALASLFSLVLLVNLASGSNRGSVSHKLHEFVVEDARDLRGLVLDPCFTLVVDILHEALNELILRVVLQVEILVLRRLQAILRCMHEPPTLIQVQVIHLLQLNIGISQQLNIPNAHQLRVTNL